MKKMFTSILFIILIVCAVLFAAKNFILKMLVEQAATQVTGFKTTLSSLSYQIPSTIHIQGLKIENPPEFQERTFVNIPEVYASVAFGELVSGKRVHLPEVRLNIQEVRIEKNTQGISNVGKLTAVAGSTKGKKKEEKLAPKKDEKAMPFQLDRLVLTIRNVSYEDHSNILAKGGIPSKVAVDLGVNQEVITNISKPEALVAIIMAKILNGATLGRVLDIDVDQMLKSSLAGMTDASRLVGVQAKKVTTELGSAADQAVNLVGQSEAAKKTGELIQDSVGQAAGTMTDVTKKTKDQVSGLFGKLGDLVPAEEKK